MNKRNYADCFVLREGRRKAGEKDEVRMLLYVPA